MVNYFHRTKKDPSDINDEILKNTLVKNHDTYIRFIRAQEAKKKRKKSKVWGCII